MDVGQPMPFEIAKHTPLAEAPARAQGRLGLERIPLAVMRPSARGLGCQAGRRRTGSSRRHQELCARPASSSSSPPEGDDVWLSGGRCWPRSSSSAVKSSRRAVVSEMRVRRLELESKAAARGANAFCDRFDFRLLPARTRPPRRPRFYAHAASWFDRNRTELRRTRPALVHAPKTD